jgi:hypothetical protein
MARTDDGHQWRLFGRSGSGRRRDRARSAPTSCRRRARNLAVTANTYSHVLADEAELDYAALLA